MGWEALQLGWTAYQTIRHHRIADQTSPVEGLVSDFAPFTGECAADFTLSTTVPPCMTDFTCCRRHQLWPS